MYNFVSFFGLFVILGISYLLSSNRKSINWNIIKWGMIFQVIISLFVFVLPIGTKFFLSINGIILNILESATAGSKFLFGRLALGPDFILAFQGLPTIIFFSSLISVLYYFKIMPLIIRGFAFIFTRLMKVSGAESLVVASNVFVGIESMLTIKPYLQKLTRSEICTILTAGMATIASSVLGLYVFTLKGTFPTIATHLISASLLSAPAALMISKILIPEIETPETLGKKVKPHYEKQDSVFEAIVSGAKSGLEMILGIIAVLIAILGIIALFDLFLGFIGNHVNSIFNIKFIWSLKNIFGYIFYPFTIIIGVPVSDALLVSQIIGERIIVTEMVSYQDLNLALLNNLLKHPRSSVICAYALCGFAHVASMAIFTGGMTAIAPKRTKDIISVAPRALLSATFACLITACFAGIFFTGKSILLG